MVYGDWHEFCIHSRDYRAIADKHALFLHLAMTILFLLYGMIKKFLFTALIGLSMLASQTQAQNVEGYADGFCSHYSYSVECYTHWNKVSEKVDSFVTKMMSAYESKP